MSPDNSKLSGGGALDEPTIAQLCEAIAPVSIEPELLKRMRARVVGSASDALAGVVREAQGEWQPLLPGVDLKVLHVDRGQRTQTSLWRLAPGAHVPAHSHANDEECLVLEGTLMNDGVSYLRGDYLFALAGSSHSEFTSPTGALLLLRGELLAGTAVVVGGHQVAAMPQSAGEPF